MEGLPDSIKKTFGRGGMYLVDIHPPQKTMDTRHDKPSLDLTFFQYF